VPQLSLLEGTEITELEEKFGEETIRRRKPHIVGK